MMFALLSVGREVPPINILVDPGIPILLAAVLSSILLYVLSKWIIGEQTNYRNILLSTLIGSLTIGIALLGILVTGWVGPVIVSFALEIGITFLLVFVFINHVFDTTLIRKIGLSMIAVATLNVTLFLIYASLSDFLFRLTFLLDLLF